MSARTIEQALREGTSRIAGAATTDPDSPAMDAQLLLCKATGRSRSSLFAWSDQALTESEAALYDSLIQQRIAGQPVAYLTGTREFWSLPLQVSPATLIPRPDTECLVEQALALELDPAAQVLDLGTGTGAIALALASERPGWQVWGSDRHAEAVELARTNGLNLGLERVRFWVSDWFRDLPEQQFDLIVANPPYIPSMDPHLGQGDVRFEPASALVAGDDGLADLQVIISQSPGRLRSGGWLVLEHGYDQAQAVSGLLAGAGFAGISLHHDYGGQARVSMGQWPGVRNDG